MQYRKMYRTKNIEIVLLHNVCNSKCLSSLMCRTNVLLNKCFKKKAHEFDIVLCSQRVFCLYYHIASVSKWYYVRLRRDKLQSYDYNVLISDMGLMLSYVSSITVFSVCSECIQKRHHHHLLSLC